MRRYFSINNNVARKNACIDKYHIDDDKIEANYLNYEIIMFMGNNY